MVIACFDVHYFDTLARAAVVVARDWASPVVVRQYVVEQPVPADYKPGQFYKRELPPLLAVIEQIQEPVDVLVIDAYCYLSEDLSPGLGAYLHEALPHPMPIVGVAKNRFRNTSHAIEVCRGGSTRSLFVTAIGMDYVTAARHVESMAGEHRIPTLLKQVDHAARSAATR